MAIWHHLGIEPWTFIQKLFFAPAGCPHQVRNLKGNLQLSNLLALMHCLCLLVHSINVGAYKYKFLMLYLHAHLSQPCIKVALHFISPDNVSVFARQKNSVCFPQIIGLKRKNWRYMFSFLKTLILTLSNCVLGNGSFL